MAIGLGQILVVAGGEVTFPASKPPGDTQSALTLRLLSESPGLPEIKIDALADELSYGDSARGGKLP